MAYGKTRNNSNHRMDHDGLDTIQMRALKKGKAPDYDGLRYARRSAGKIATGYPTYRAVTQCAASVTGSVVPVVPAIEKARDAIQGGRACFHSEDILCFEECALRLLSWF